MPEKSTFIILSAVLLFMQFGIIPSFAQEDNNTQKITVQPVSGFNETKFDAISQDLAQDQVVIETPERKKKRILPFLIWAGSSWLALDAVNSTHGMPSPQLIDANGVFSDHNQLFSKRITDTVISRRILPSRINWNNDLETNIQSGQVAQSRLSDFAGDNPEWHDGFLIGRLHPVYVSLTKSGNDKSGILIAGLNNLKDGEIALVELYDDSLHYSIQLNNTDSDDLGVFKTEVDLKSSRVRMSIQIIR